MTLEQRVNDALKLRDTSKTDYLDDLLEINKDHPGNPAVLGLIAHTEWELGQLHNAVRHARELVQVSPRNESASLVLFHALWERGDIQDAIREMDRFQDLSHSDDYDQFEKWVKGWGQKRKSFDFSDLPAYGREESTKVVLAGPPPPADEEE